jgi:hypothetical protein
MTDKICGDCQHFNWSVGECTNPPHSHFRVKANHRACSVYADVGIKAREIVRRFIEDNGIGCVETIYQTDRVAENALPLIEALCELMGYKREA